MESSQAVSIIESDQENTHLINFQFSFWKDSNGKLRVVRIINSYDARLRPRGKIVASYSTPDLIQLLNDIRQQLGEPILNIYQELLNRKCKRRYISSLIEETLINNGYRIPFIL